MYIGDYLTRRELYSPDKLAFIDAGKNPEWYLSYRQANQRANQLANWLKRQGISKGDRVAILARDGYEHLDLFFACSKLGAIHTALNWRLHWQELYEIFRNTTPKILVFSDDFKANVEQLIARYPLITLHLDGAGVAGSLNFENTLQSAPDSAVSTEDLQAEDIAALIFTGGTTGLPKAAQVSHRMIADEIHATIKSNCGYVPYEKVKGHTRCFRRSKRFSRRSLCLAQPCWLSIFSTFNFPGFLKRLFWK